MLIRDLGMFCVVKAASEYKSKDGKTIGEMYPEATHA